MGDDCRWSRYVHGTVSAMSSRNRSTPGRRHRYARTSTQMRSIVCARDGSHQFILASFCDACDGDEAAGHPSSATQGIKRLPCYNHARNATCLSQIVPLLCNSRAETFHTTLRHNADPIDTQIKGPHHRWRDLGCFDRTLFDQKRIQKCDCARRVRVSEPDFSRQRCQQDCGK